MTMLPKDYAQNWNEINALERKRERRKQAARALRKHALAVLVCVGIIYVLVSVAA